MKILDIKSDDFSNFRDKTGKSSLFVGIGSCDWKCCNESGIDKKICQNSRLATLEPKEISSDELLNRYLGESGSVVVGGLEPFNDMSSLMQLAISCAKREVEWFIVYTGYIPFEISHLVFELWEILSGKCRFVVKFGRYLPNQEPHTDELLGVPLASYNQKAEEITGKWFIETGFEESVST